MNKIRPDRAPTSGRKASFLLLLLSPALVFLPSCDRGNGGDGSTIIAAGSTSVQPFAEKLAEDYMAVHPDRTVNVQGGGSTAGVKAAQTRAAQIGMSSRNLKKEEEASGLKATTIAFDGIALIVHRGNPLNGLTREEAARIFAGEIRRWEEVGGPAGDIHFVTREEGSGTRGAFEEMVMDKREIAPRALVQDSNGAVREIVANDPKAFGYISLGLVDARVKALAMDGIRPSEEAIVAKRYPIWRPFLFLTRGEPAGPARNFIDYVLGPEGQRMLASEGLVPVN